MGVDGWVAGEILLDLILLGFLTYVIFWIRQRNCGAEFAEDEKVTSALQEIQQLRRGLDRNLSEKRALTTKILERLDRRLASADELSRNLERLLEQAQKISPSGSGHDTGPEDSKGAAVTALDAKGMSAREIASVLQIPFGEVALMLKLKQTAENTE